MCATYDSLVDKDPSDGELDRFNITAGQKSEHYEIACYGNLTPMAAQLSFDEAADMLEQNMREEQDALEELSQRGEQFNNGRLEA